MSTTRTAVVGADSWTADTAEVGADDGVVQLVGTGPDRAAVTVMVDVDSTGDLWVVPQAGRARGGIRVAPGAGLVIGSKAPVYGYVKTGRAMVYLLSESGQGC